MAQDKQPYPRTLIFAAGTTGGILVALTAQIVLVRFGLDLAAVWRELFVSRAAQMRSAFAWWIVAGFSFLGGFLIAAFAKYFSAHWWRLRVVRWIGGAIVVGALAVVGHLASAPTGLAPAPNVVVGVTVIAASTLLAMLGAFFIVRR
jgi:hypothetical protein